MQTVASMAGAQIEANTTMKILFKLAMVKRRDKAMIKYRGDR